MVKVVVAQLNEKPSRTKRSGVTRKVVVTADGRREILTVDAHGPTLNDDLREVFQRNINKARRENKKVLGTFDVVPAKA